MVSLNCVERSGREPAVSRLNNPLLKLHRAGDLADCNSLIERSRCRKLVVDCSGVEMMSSDTLGRLLILQRRMRKSGGRLILSGLREEVRQMFAWTKLERCFEIQPSAGRMRLLPVTEY
jgi:anti-anti-sigma factor